MSFESNKWQTLKCLWCYCDFDALTKDINRGRGMFCSPSCAAQYGNSLRPGAESESRLRQIAREIYIERHGDPICKECGSSADVHHNDENIRNNADKNHTPLCRGCHTAYHNSCGRNAVEHV